MIVTALKQNFKGKITDGIYLHGLLEQENEFDLVQLDEIPDKDGIYNCITIIDDKQIPSILYFWKHFGLNRGLVVKENDDYYNSDAKEQYELKVSFL